MSFALSAVFLSLSNDDCDSFKWIRFSPLEHHVQLWRIECRQAESKKQQQRFEHWAVHLDEQYTRLHWYWFLYAFFLSFFSLLLFVAYTVAVDTLCVCSVHWLAVRVNSISFGKNIFFDHGTALWESLSINGNKFSKYFAIVQFVSYVWRMHFESINWLRR